MYSPFRLGYKYLKYYITAANGKGHGIHSPFVFEFVTKVLNDNRRFYAYDKIENLRKLLLANPETIAVADFGAGSRVEKADLRKVSEIAHSSLKPAKFGQLLFRIVNYYAPAAILELGTSLGITTAYLSLAKPDASVITMEGAPEIAAIARKNLAQLEITNVKVVEGNFDDTLATTLQANSRPHLVFVDGNHRYEPTVRYFREILLHMQEYSILIFDDIHWSVEMEKAWEEIKKDASVTLSIDLFFIGLIFFRKEQKEKQHFVIRF